MRYGGAPNALHVWGRVLVDEGAPTPDAQRSAWRNFVDTAEALESDEVPGVPVIVRVAGRGRRVLTDGDGLWTVDLDHLIPPLAAGRLSVQARLAVLKPAGVVGEGEVVVVPARGVGVISDYDDTVVQTGVADKAGMAVRTLTHNAAQVQMVPGAPEAYRAAAAAGAVAFFYVSGSPQNLYDRIDAVLKLHDMPTGPILLKNVAAAVAVAPL